MKIYTQEEEWDGGETAVAFGMFDGVHLGHRKLIETNCREAEKRGLTGMVFTFSNHPLSIITPEQIPLQINTTEEKIADLESCGVSAVLLRPFDREFAGLSAEAFVERIALTLHPRLFVIGFNYTFGAHGCGRAEDMQRLGKKYGIDTCIVDRVQLAGDTVSSSRIRAALAEGQIDLANTMLGRRRKGKAPGTDPGIPDREPVFSGWENHSPIRRLCLHGPHRNGQLSGRGQCRKTSDCPGREADDRGVSAGLSGRLAL